MTYGLSRDDAGRFMSDYVQRRLPEDPFHVLDVDGVGEPLKIGVERGRTANSGDVVGLVVRQGTLNQSRFADVRDRLCVPFAVPRPVARLAAAQLAIADRLGNGRKTGPRLSLADFCHTYVLRFL